MKCQLCLSMSVWQNVDMVHADLPKFSWRFWTTTFVKIGSHFHLVLTNETSIAFVNDSVAKCWHGSQHKKHSWQAEWHFHLQGPCLDLTMPAPAAGLMPHDSLDPAGSALCPTSLGQSDQVCELWQMEQKFHASLTNCENIHWNIQWVCEFWQMENKFHTSLSNCCIFHCNSKCPGGASTNVASDGAASLLSFANKCASGFACKQMGLRKMEISKKALFFTTKTSYLCKKQGNPTLGSSCFPHCKPWPCLQPNVTLP